MVKFYAISLQTRTYPCLTLLHSAWYSNKKKVIASTILEDLTPVALAVWAQGDGSKQNSGFVLNTQSFTLQQVVLLINVLIIKYRLDCTIYYDRNLPRIIRPNSMSTFRTLVTPHFHPSMLYKLR